MDYFKKIFWFLPVFIGHGVFAQGFFSGDVMVNADFYDRDPAIGAAGTPHYDNLKSSLDSWIYFKYTNPDYDFETGVRFDFFLNSNLHNPGVPYNGYGIGYAFARKRIQNLSITGGYFYDQIGTGIAFRAYEERGLGIDNALFGVHLEYDIHKNWKAKAFGGVQKNRFTFYKPFIKGVDIEGNIPVSSSVMLNMGAAVVNRTLDQQSMDIIVSNIESYDIGDRFIPRYNTYVFALYNTLTIRDFTWYIEGAYKTHEAIVDREGKLRDKAGNILYSSLTYSIKGFGATLKLKRTENFTFRTSPNEILLNGMIAFIPPVNKQNSLRLPARYSPASQEIDEKSWGLDITASPAKGFYLHFNYSEINDKATAEDNIIGIKFNESHTTPVITKKPRFREINIDLETRKSGKIKSLTGFQYIEYDQDFYEVKPGVPVVKAYTPFAELTYKLTRRHSLRWEGQYMYTKQDFGQWLYGLLEFTLAPHWSISVSDMWNVKPLKTEDKLHYYNVFGSYTINAHRFSISYVKQVEGIVCTGGVCRYEPAFSGVKVAITSSF